MLPLAVAAKVGAGVFGGGAGRCGVLLGTDAACLWLPARSCNVAIALTSEA